MAERSSPRSRARFDPVDLLRGLSYPLRGYRVLRRYPELSRYWVMPIALTFVALVGSVALTYAYTDDLLAMLWQPPPSDSWLRFAYTGAHVIASVLCFALLTLACVMLSTIVASPFNDLLSEALEERITKRPSAPFSLPHFTRELVRTVSLSLVRLLIYAAVLGPLWLLSWLMPGPGQLLYIVAGTLLTSAYFALDYVDWPASRHGLAPRERWGLLRSRPLLMLGFGFSVWLCLFIPLVNLAFMPLSVAGGTLLFLDLQAGTPEEPSHRV